MSNWKLKGIVIIMLGLFIIAGYDYCHYNGWETCTDDRTKEQGMYHPKGAIQGHINITGADECLFDECAGNSYIVIWRNDSVQIDFHLYQRTGLFLFYYMIICDGYYMINGQIRNGGLMHYQVMSFNEFINTSQIIINSLNSTIKLYEVYGLEYWPKDPKVVIDKYVRFTIFNWEEIEDYFHDHKFT
jgi:hypothetical protein